MYAPMCVCVVCVVCACGRTDAFDDVTQCTVEHVSRDQMLRRERGRKKRIVQLTTSRIGAQSEIKSDDLTYIHAYSTHIRVMTIQILCTPTYYMAIMLNSRTKRLYVKAAAVGLWPRG